MSRNMLHPKKSHRVRNFFLIMGALILGIIVIGALQQAKHSTTPPQSTASSQITPQPSPVSAATATTSQEPSPASVRNRDNII